MYIFLLLVLQKETIVLKHSDLGSIHFMVNSYRRGRGRFVNYFMIF